MLLHQSHNGVKIPVDWSVFLQISLLFPQPVEQRRHGVLELPTEQKGLFQLALSAKKVAQLLWISLYCGVLRTL